MWRTTRPISDMARVQPRGTGSVNFTDDHVLWYHLRQDNSIIFAIKGYRFLPRSSNHKAWVYYRFCLSYRDLEELMATRRIVRAYEDTSS